jgi:predicted phosphate transport protein (TIGR00153 family)
VTAHLVAEPREPRSLWRRIRYALRPRERRFFAAFDQHAALCVDGMRALKQLLADVRDPDGRVREIEAIEKRGDAVEDSVRSALRRSLFPPFARVAVHDLINRLDDVLDLIEDAAQSVHLYHITQVTPEAIRLTELGLDSALKLQAAIAQLARMDNSRAILALCAEVDALEAQADHVMRSAMSKLFREETDARQLVKLKAIYELLEELTDRCKDVASDVQALVLKYGA